MNTAQQAMVRRSYGGAKSAVSGYMENEVLQWSPEKIILKTYDLFIVSCKKRDAAKMNKILVTLMTSLNFDHPDQATRLYRMYEYCQESIRKKRFDEALKIIKGLRDTWAQAFKLKG